MTDYHTEPINAADMRPGDLLQEINGPAAPPPVIYIGPDPTDGPEVFYAIYPHYVCEATIHVETVPGSWHKLTPKPEPTRCRYCGEVIDRILTNPWWHKHNQSSFCRTTIATPDESESA